MTDDVEAQVENQARLDWEIERNIARRRRRQRQLVIGVSLVLIVSGALAAANFLKRMSEPEVGADDLFTSAVELRDEGDLIGATKRFRRVLTLSPDHEEARWLLGVTLNEIGDGRAGEKELRHARMLGRKDVDMTVALLESLMLQRRYTEVLVETVSAVTASDDVRLLLTQGEAQMGLGQYAKSRETFTALLEKSPENVPTLLALTRLSLATGDLDAAESFLERARRLEPERHEVRVLAGRVALERGDFEPARREFGEPAPGKSTPEISLGIAQSYLAEGRPDAADDHLRALGKSARGATELRYLSGVAAIQRGELSRARTVMVDLLKDEPEHIDSLLLLAWINYAREEYQQAESSVRRVLGHDPDIVAARLLQGAVQLELGYPENAIETLRVVEEKTPDDAQLLALLARAFMQADEPEEAERYLEKAAASSSTVSVASEMLRTEEVWEFRYCDSLIHYCRHCLYLRECG